MTRSPYTIDVKLIDLDPTRLCEGVKFEVLATNIAQHGGLVHPLIVRPLADRFVVVEGARRLKALRWLDVTSAPVRFVAGTTAATSLLSMIEVEEALGLDGFTLAEAIERAGTLYDFTVRAIAEWTGASPRKVFANYSLLMRACPGLVSAVHDGWVLPSQALLIAARPALRQREILKTIFTGRREGSHAKGSGALHGPDQRYRRRSREESTR